MNSFLWNFKIPLYRKYIYLQLEIKSTNYNIKWKKTLTSEV